MLAEFGHFLLIIGVMSSVAACMLAGLSTASSSLPPSFRTRVATQTPFWVCSAFIAILAATCLLAVAFVGDDFSLTYVAQHSNSALPVIFKVAAVWGGHEGSFLFMLLALSGWSVLLVFSRALPPTFRQSTVFVLAAMVAVLGVYCLWLSNPFLRQLPVPIEGRDLNPMLQDVGLILHPPLLYLGYIGFGVPFALAVAALLTQSLPDNWARICRHWTLAAWAFLTIGIALGSWWAYHELGWGGWWFWDPVENASLLPWLTATALIHCLVISERKSQMVGWSLLLGITTFALSILGTFIVRSGVLTSVHAFAADPMRGNGLLLILALLLLPALTLYALRAPRLIQQTDTKLTLNSQTFWMMLCACLLVAMTFIVMLGTFYPMIFAGLGLGTLSVGAPYFNTLFVPLVLLTALAASLSMLRQHALKARLAVMLSAMGAASVAMWVLQRGYQTPFSLLVWLALSASLALLLASVMSLRKKGQKTPWAMVMSHAGLAVAMLGATLLSGFGGEVSLKMADGHQATLGPYTVTHVGNEWAIGPNYTAERVTFVVEKEGAPLGTAGPEKRHYTVRTMNMSEAGVLRDGLSDVYITLGSKLDKHSYAVRIQSKPYVQLLWLGGIMMMVGGFAGVMRRAAIAVRHSPDGISDRQADPQGNRQHEA